MTSSQPSPIVVTGAGSGIGWHLTGTLSDRGMEVLATARRPEDLKRLAGLRGVTPVDLDVRDVAAIRETARKIEATVDGLSGLVNNAGMGGIGPFIAYTESELNELFSVNVHAPIHLANALLPLLLRARGRIVNIGSQGGSITSKYFGPYTMTKHALEAMTASLGEELQPHGVHVSIVQPGGIESRIGETSLPSSIERFRRAPAPLDEEALRWAQALEGDAPDSGLSSDPPDRRPSPPSIVTEAVLHALFAERPRLRYLVGTRWEGNRVIHTLLQRLVDANACETLRYSREELVAFLDEHLQEGATAETEGGTT